MKTLPIYLILLAGWFPLSGQENPIPQWNVAIPDPLSEGKPSVPAPKPEPIPFEVLSSRTERMQVTEAPEMPDLPPVKGTINVTVQMVKDPGLPDPPPPLPALPPEDPAVIARMQELREHYQGTKYVFLSATVYDHSRTFLRIYPNGKREGETSAWSNLDFNHFSGFSTFRVTAVDGTFHDVGFLKGLGNTSTLRQNKQVAQKGNTGPWPDMPALPDLSFGGPTFTVTAGAQNGDVMETLSLLHELYRKEGVRMEAAFHAREKAYAERHAFLLAHPPVPEDIVIRFWQRDQSSAK